MKLHIGERTGAAKRLSLYEVGYVKLRTGMAALAAIFPLIFLISSWVLHRTQLQDSISAYYFAGETERNLFVGILITIGVFLMLYEGYSKLEDRVLTVAGVLAVGIALVPMGTITWPVFNREISVHGICAVSFFACIFFVCVFLSRTTVSDLSPRMQAFYVKRYRLFAGLMIGSVLVVLLANILPKSMLEDLFGGTLVFWVEAVGVWAFALFWYYKTREVNPAIPWRPFARRTVPLTPV